MKQPGLALATAILVSLIVTGCITTNTKPTSVTTMNNTNTSAQPLTVSSPAFNNGEQIPTKYGYTQENVNPPLQVSGVPDKAESLVLILDDPDAVEPAGKVWLHWLAWDINPDQKITEDSEPGVQGRNDFGELGYGGPNPPDKQHRYHFRVYALDTTLNLQTGANRSDVETAMKGHVIAQGELTGTYSPGQGS